jgi:MFS family permease
LSREVRLYLASWAVFGFTLLNGIYPVLFNLYLLRLGYGPEFVGLVNAVGLFGYALFAFPSGILADRFGLRRMMALGVVLSALCNGLQALVEFLPRGWHEPWILVQQGLGTMGISLYFVNSQPFLIEATGSSERNHAYSMRMALGTLAGFVGSLVGGALPDLLALWLGVTLAHPAPYRYALLLAAGLCMAGFLLMLPLCKEREVRAKEDAGATGAGSGPAPVWTFVAMAFVVLLRMAGVGTSRTFFNVYLDDGLGVPTAQIGLLFALVQLVAVPAALAMPALSRRWGNFRLVFGGTLGIVASTLPLALIPHWAAATAGRIGVYAISSITDAAMGVYQMEIVPQRWRSTMAGVSSLALGLSWTSLSLGGGYLIAWMGYRTLFLTGGGLTLAGILLFWVVFRGQGCPAPVAVCGPVLDAALQDREGSAP